MFSPALGGVRFPAVEASDTVYLDSAATTQKPQQVIDAVHRYLSRDTANAGRGSYAWSTRLAAEIEQVRARAAAFVGARDPAEIVFTAGATAAMNAVALAWGLGNLADGDEILYSPADHASTVAPWRRLRTILAGFGRRIRLVPYAVTALGEADLTDLAGRIGPCTRMIVVTHLHHVFGAVTTLEELRAHLPPSVVLVFDCSQSGGHLPVDVRELGADFAIFAAHKMFATPGTGMLYCASRVHERLAAFLPGGGPAATAADPDTAPMPHRLEGGTADLPGILALGAALDVLDTVGRDRIAEHNRLLTRLLVDGLRTVRGIEFRPGPAYAPCEIGYGIVSFTLDGIGAADLGFVLAELGFLVRTGVHCVPAAAPGAGDESVRASTHIYTTADDIGRFVAAVTTIAQEVQQ